MAGRRPDWTRPRLFTTGATRRSLFSSRRAGHFGLNTSLKAGEHELVVAWEWPHFVADLVVGVADTRSKQWLPFALAKR